MALSHRTPSILVTILELKITLIWERYDQMLQNILKYCELIIVRWVQKPEPTIYYFDQRFIIMLVMAYCIKSIIFAAICSELLKTVTKVAKLLIFVYLIFTKFYKISCVGWLGPRNTWLINWTFIYWIFLMFVIYFQRYAGSRFQNEK